LRVVVVRPCNNYGPWQFPEKLIPVAINKIMKGQKVPVYGKGMNVREWLFVSDCAQAVWMVANKAKPGTVYNIGSGQEKRNIDTVKLLLKIMGKGNDLIGFVKDRLGHDLRYSLDCRKIKKELGWQAKVDFEDGLKQTTQWYIS